MKKSTLFELSLTCIYVLTFIMSSFPKLPLVTTILSFVVFFLVSILVKYLISKETMLTDHISVIAERKRIRAVFITIINLTLVAVAMEPYILSKFKVHTPGFYTFNHSLGYVAFGVFVLSFLLLPAFKMLKTNNKIHKFISNLKSKEIVHKDFELKIFNLHRKCTDKIAKWLRKWHVPQSLLGICFVAYHTFLALINGFKFNYTYITGFADLFVLLLLSVIGLLRFKKLDRNAHKYLAYIFFLLFVLHIIASELRM